MGCSSAHVFPDCFPENFEAEILPRGLAYLKIGVYRICTNGEINKESFMGTYEMIVRGLKPPQNGMDLTSPSTYSTSCYEEYRDVRNSLKCLRRYHPSPIICYGVATSDLGPLQRTKERLGQPNGVKRRNSHVDWWLYADADPSVYFEVYCHE